MYWVPSKDFRYSLKRGMAGTDVAALQLNLRSLVVDGDFGPLTERAVRRFQRSRPRLVTDGIAGPATQMAVALREMRRPAKLLPRGLLRSIASNESGFFLGSAGPHASDNGWDVGVFARSSGEAAPGQTFLENAYDVYESACWTTDNLIDQRAALGVPVRSWYADTLAPGDLERYRWMVAVLAHNWPAGAFNLARRGAVTVDYPGDENDDDKPAGWIIAATAGRLSTPREWALSYIARATVYMS